MLVFENTPSSPGEMVINQNDEVDESLDLEEDILLLGLRPSDNISNDSSDLCIKQVLEECMTGKLQKQSSKTDLIGAHTTSRKRQNNLKVY